MGFSAERGSWAWRGREASCSPKTTQSPAGPRQPSKLGRSCETCSFHPSQGWAWMEHTHTPAYAQPVCAQTSLCICAQTCVCLGIIFCGHRYMRTPRRFCYLVTQHNLVQMSAYSFYWCHPSKGCSPLTAAPPPSSPLCLVSLHSDISS